MGCESFIFRVMGHICRRYAPPGGLNKKQKRYIGRQRREHIQGSLGAVFINLFLDFEFGGCFSKTIANCDGW